MAIDHWTNLEQQLMEYGAKSLSDPQLLGLLFGRGGKGLSATEFAAKTIKDFGGLHPLLACKAKNFLNYPGLGKSQYTQLQASLEISHRYCFAKIKNKPVLESPWDTKQFLLGQLRDNPREIFACLFLNSEHAIINYRELFQGTINQAEVHPREVIKLSLEENAAAVILVHNHPSGNSTPSQADQELTQQLTQGLGFVSIAVIDHLVIGSGNVYSFAEHGLL